MIYNRLVINSADYTDALSMNVSRTMGKSNATSKFWIEFDNNNGQYDDTFTLNDEVIIYADKDSTPATTKIFTGVIEDIKFTGQEQDERVTLKGRDYGAILQDIIVSPRIFKNQDAGDIIKSLIIQNATNKGITTTNVDSVGSTITRITFNNMSLFEAIKQLGEATNFYFFVDENKDLYFKAEDSINSGLTFDNTNVTKSTVRHNDSEIYNKVTVYGDRQLTASRETFGAQAGSAYTLDDKPYNVGVIGSADPNIPIQPGGILNVNDPLDEDVKFLVDFQSSQIVLTSGTTAGDNTGWTGSSIIIDYQRSSPLISIRQDTTSQSSYGEKHKIIVDRNIKDINEANDRAITVLAEQKDPKVEVDIWVHSVVDVTPGNTAIVNIPFHNVSNQTYMILSANYSFNKINNLSDNVLQLTLSRSLRDVLDYFKDHELRLRVIEGAEVDTSITNLETATGSTTVVSSGLVISRSIGSAFYLHIPGHNMVENSSSLIGDIRAGSTIGALN